MYDDKVGNRLGLKIDNNPAHVYDYDKLYQLTFVDYNDGNSTDYYYDSLGNRTSVVNGGTTDYSRNELNQYTAVGGVDYDYDLNGNLADTNNGQYEYVYDCENRLIEAKKNGQTVATYTYDYAGRRVSKTVGGTTTKYCYDGSQVIEEYENGTLVRQFFYGPGIDEPIAMYDVSGSSWYWYHYDGLGSVIALSNVNGEIVERYSYDVFGEATIRDPGNGIRETSLYGNPYMFTGRRYDDETGLYYYRARYYSPKLGRFLQTDPIGYSGGLNLYTYVLNNPVNWVDPYGLISAAMVRHKAMALAHSAAASTYSQLQEFADYPGPYTNYPPVDVVLNKASMATAVLGGVIGGWDDLAADQSIKACEQDRAYRKAKEKDELRKRLIEAEKARRKRYRRNVIDQLNRNPHSVLRKMFGM